jgi:hypothetical protein
MGIKLNHSGPASNTRACVRDPNVILNTCSSKDLAHAHDLTYRSADKIAVSDLLFHQYDICCATLYGQTHSRLFSQAFLHNAHIPGNTDGPLNIVPRQCTPNILPCAREVRVEVGEFIFNLLFNTDSDTFGCSTTVYFLVVLRCLAASTFFACREVGRSNVPLTISFDGTESVWRERAVLTCVCP